MAKIILLGLDVHAESITVVRQIDGGMPQPAQKFSGARLLDWVRRQHEQAETVWACYEAGPFGYQPGYRAVQRWSAVLHAPGKTSAVRKKAIVAVARQLAIDLWRIATGRVQAQDLGLILN